MKKIMTLVLSSLLFVTCSKNNDHCTPVSPDAESGEMKNFCNAQGINYTVDENGIYYEIIDHGTGQTPNLNSVITVTYKAMTLDGNIVKDKTPSPVTEQLNEFIEGWRIALPYIQKGGRIKMIIPSSLAYGCTGIPDLIMPNAPLYYDVVLMKVE